MGLSITSVGTHPSGQTIGPRDLRNTRKTVDGETVPLATGHSHPSSVLLSILYSSSTYYLICYLLCASSNNFQGPRDRELMDGQSKILVPIINSILACIS